MPEKTWVYNLFVGPEEPKKRNPPLVELENQLEELREVRAGIKDHQKCIAEKRTREAELKKSIAKLMPRARKAVR